LLFLAKLRKNARQLGFVALVPVIALSIPLRLHPKAPFFFRRDIAGGITCDTTRDTAGGIAPGKKTVKRKPTDATRSLCIEFVSNRSKVAAWARALRGRSSSAIDSEER
jgi:hypothetical protein